MKRLRWPNRPKKRSDEADPGRYFAALRNETHEDSFPAVREWLRRVDNRQYADVPLNPMKIFFNTYKTRLIVSCLLLAITVISCTTPVEHEETVGYMVSGTIAGERVTSVTRQLQTLNWVQSNELELGIVSRKGIPLTKRGAEVTEYVIKEKEIPLKGYALMDPASNYQFAIPLPETVESQARAWADDLRSIAGITELNVSPLQVMAEEPAYKVVLNSIRDTKTFEFKPDNDQLKEAIRLNLHELEIQGFELKELQDVTNNKTLYIEVPADVEQSGLVTLKKFLSDAKPQDMQPASSAKLLEQYEEVKSRMEGLEAGPEKEKLETYLKQLETKVDAVRNQ